MKHQYKNMTIIVKNDYDNMGKKAARILAAQVTIKPNSILGLATGSTPEGMYKKLVKMYQKDEVDFSEVTTFNLDEYYPINASNKQSYAYYMQQHFFKYVNVKDEAINIPNSSMKDINLICENYEEKIRATGGIDLQILGIGNNGHIGFNEPDVHFESETHLVTLDEATIKANARFFDKSQNVPKLAISMGIRTIMQTKKIVLLASGANKAQIICDTITGVITPKVPASILQLHQDVVFILDKEAASKVMDRINH